jgi:chromosome segregation ATPase
MNRRLNPDLFGPQTMESRQETSYSAVAARKMENELKQAKKQISHLESLIEVVQSQMASLQQNTDRRSEAFSKAINELEKDFRQGILEQERKMRTVDERLRDQQIKDQQMEAMVERYNNNLVQFENRLAMVQKSLSEKEMSLMTYRQIIEKIIDEVEALKARNRHSARI